MKMLGRKLLPSFFVIIQPTRALHIKRSELYKKCFALLGVEESSDQNTVRRAYIELVKKVHPDSGLPEASAERFQEIDEAFKILQEKFAKNRRGIFEDDEEKVFDIRHTAPQHRQYLSYEGIGIGTPFQREKQYQQIKAMKAQERVLKHRVEKAQAGEKAIMKKSNFYKNHAIKTKYGLERVVEDLIQEAMQKGDFDNLSGTGKPLSQTQSQNPYLDFTTHKLNKILLDNGFTPEWITLQREIREEIDLIKKKLANHRAYLGDPPLSEDEQTKWLVIISNYKTDVEKTNKKIDKFNLIVPIMDNQMFRLKLGNLAENVLNDPELERNKQRDRNLSPKLARKDDYKVSDFFSFIGSLF